MTGPEPVNVPALLEDLRCAHLELARANRLHENLLDLMQDNALQIEQAARAAQQQLRAIHIQRLVLRHLLLQITHLVDRLDARSP